MYRQTRARTAPIAALALSLLAPVSLLEAAAPAGQWWNGAYAERLNITVTAGATAVPTDYSMLVTIDHARMVSTGRSLASGDDVRVVYWNGGGWVELDRLLDDQSSWNNYRTGLWFRTQAGVGAFTTDDNYYIYYNDAAAGAPPTNWANVFLFYDDFNSGGLDTATRWACTGTCTQSGGTLSLPAGASVFAQAAHSFGFDTRWEGEQRLVSPFANLNHFGAGDQDSFCCAGSNDWVVFWHDGIDPEWETGDNATLAGTFYSNATPGSFHVYTFDRVGSGSVRFSLDNFPFHNETGIVPTATLRPRLENDGGGASEVITDWIRVRKYVVPEPDANARRETFIVGGSCAVVTDIGGSAYDSSQPYWGNDAAHAVALQSDGKILVGGYGYVGWATDFAVARYNSDFRLDTTLGAAGIATTNVDFDDQAYGLAIQPDGKIVLGGHDRVGVPWADDDFAAVRYDTNGGLDTTFNAGGVSGGPPNRAGMVTTAVDSLWDLGQPMVLQDDGKIVVAGPVRVGGGGGQYDFGLARFSANGSIDLTFGGGGTGTKVTAVGTGDDYGNDLVFKPNPGGYILVAGGVQNATFDFGLVRYDLNGNLDASFGAGGIVMTDLRGTADWGTSVVVQPDGKIVMTGQSNNGTDLDFAVVRYDADGSLDATFGSGGMVFTPIGPGDDRGGGVALQPDGKIVVTGSAHNGSDFDFAAARYNPDGTLDTSFGFGGKVVSPIGGGDDNVHDVALQPDGRIVLVGESYNTLTQDPDFAMLRYNADGSLDNTCGQVFYSIGTDPSDLATGSPTITITSGTATLSTAQTNDVGVGDVIDYDTDNKLVYISAVVSPTELRVQTAGGSLPPDAPTPVSVNSIQRAFNSISSAVTGSSTLLGTSNLVTLEKGLTWVCYDDGPLVETANLNGYTTDAAHFVTLTVAGASQVVTGVSQRHTGIEGTGTVVTPPLNGGILVRDDFTVVEWLEIESVSDTEAAYSMVMLDRYEVSYPRRLQAVAGRLEGRFRTSGTAEIQGLTEAVVIEKSDAGITWLEGVKASSRSGVAFRVEADRAYLAVSPDALLAVEVQAPEPSRLKDTAQRAEYVMIGPREFLPAAVPLIERRRSQGLEAQAVAIEDVFSEFGFGEESPKAIRDFLSYAYHQWEAGPRYVLLLGDATYDFEDRMGTGVVNRVPPMMVMTRYLETASDPAYAAVNGDDLLPDLAIGRLPAANVEELLVMVAKILALETSGRSLDGRAVLIADDPDRAGDFVADAESLAATVLSGRDLEKVYLSRLGVAVSRDEIRQAFDEGSSLMSYIGHGGIHLWADENLFSAEEVAGLSLQSRQPMLLTLNCLNGYFHFPYSDALAEALVKAEGKGAIAAISPSGLSVNDAAAVLHRALLQELLDSGHLRLGDALLAAQSAYAQTGALPEMLAIYHLFGDPAMTLR